MIRILFTVLCLLPVVSASPILKGQVRVDSLTQRLTQTSGEEKATVCLQLMQALKFSDQALAEEHGQSGLALARNLELTNLEGKLLLNLGIVHAIGADYPASLTYYEQAADRFREVDNAKGIGQAYSNMGLTYARRGGYEEAMVSYDKAVVLFRALEDTTTVLLIRGNMANLAFRQGRYEEAKDIYGQLLELGQQNNKPGLIARYNANLGRVAYRQGAHSEALDHFYKALDLHEASNNKAEKANLLNNIGLLFSALDMEEQALKAFTEGREIGSLKDKGKIDTNLARLLVKQKKYQEAKVHILRAIATYEELGVKSTAQLYQTLASVQIAQGQFSEARVSLDHALQTGLNMREESASGRYHLSLGQLAINEKVWGLAEDELLLARDAFLVGGSVSNRHAVAELLAMVYEKKADYEQAFEYQKISAGLGDSLKRLSRDNRIIQIELERQRQSFHAAKNKEVKAGPERQSGWLWFGLLLLGLIVVAGIFMIRKIRTSNQRLNTSLNAAREDNQEIKASLKQTNLDMTLLSLDLAKREDLLGKIAGELRKIARNNPSEKDILQLVRSITRNGADNKEWEVFKKAYEQVFPRFFDGLQKDHPALSVRELRHCSLIRLNLSPQEVADITGVSVSSVHKARHRLRTKIGLARSEKLESFVLEY